ncbi:hypothetical protein ACIPVB_15065 [Microbacterium sp. NPDC090007]|uniref:hypothetical protein n=1 Tax=Microbacterium sp. NPDC090007 TaxID=3364204 RepID=UPI003815C522
MTAATFTRSWPSVSAWGAGLIVAALGAGAIVRADSGAAARGLGIGMVVLGVAGLAWGAAALSTGRIVLPRVALIGVITALAATAALIFLAPAHTSIIGVAAASVLLVVVGATAATHLRRGRTGSPADRTPRPMSVLGLVVAAAVVAVLVTPALGATQDAVLLREDGTVPVISHEGH